MIPLLLATRNAHKTREFAKILGDEFVVSDLTKLGEIPPVEENGETFAENAILKAVAISRALPDLVAADDSGLEVEALGGAPGIFSARYSGANATDAENIEKLLSQLMGASNRQARFRCAIALARHGKQLAVFEGAVKGEIASTVRGKNGFGYDPIFLPAGFEGTFAELGDDVKNRISHRARAIEQLRAYLACLRN